MNALSVQPKRLITKWTPVSRNLIRIATMAFIGALLVIATAAAVCGGTTSCTLEIAPQPTVNVNVCGIIVLQDGGYVTTCDE